LTLTQPVIVTLFTMGSADVIKRAIIGFHQDEYDAWVAELACGQA